MYLEHFNIKELPFTLLPNTGFFCHLPSYQEALNIVLLSLRNREGFIKIVGEVGTGKTLLCRMVLEKLEGEFITAYIPNPDLRASGLREALAQELNIPKPYPLSQQAILNLITERLLAYHDEGKQVVLLIDEAQALPTESLEALRLLTNLETGVAKLLQVVLFGQPELDERLNQADLRQLKQRISFSYRLPQLNRLDLEAYLYHRLAKAGYTFGALFTKRACNLLFRKSRGVPRVVNILCHKAMMVAYGRGALKVDHKAVGRAVADSECVETVAAPRKAWRFAAIGLCGALMVLIIGIALRHFK
jgi:MSHA biogenesis protein MshM